MKTFSDNSGRTWTIAITVDAIKRVHALVGVNLARILDPQRESTLPLLTELQADIVLLCDVLFALIKPQADTQSVSDEQFGQALGGDAIAAAHTAFWEEMVSFFRSLPHGQATVTAIRKHEEMVTAGMKAAQERIEAMGVKREPTAMPPNRAGGIDPPLSPLTPGSSAGNSPASSASTRGRTRSASSR